MGMGGHNYLLSALDLGTANQPTPASRTVRNRNGRRERITVVAKPPMTVVKRNREIHFSN